LQLFQFWNSGCGAAAPRAHPYRGAALCVLMSALAGCVHYHSAPLDAGQSAADFAARTLDDPALRDEVARFMPKATTWPPPAWDRGTLLAVALARSPQLALARARVAAALAHEITAAQAPDPDLLLESEYARHDAHPWLYGVGLNWLLRGAERRRLQVEIARLDTGNARLQLMDEAWAVRRALASALTDWEGEHRRLRLLERLAAAQDRLLDVVGRRVEAGEDAPGELIGVRLAGLQIEQEHSESQQAAQHAQAGVARALGLPPRALDDVALVWPDWGEPPPVDENRRRAAREQALLSRADLGLAIGDYAQAETKLRQSIVRQYPEITLGPGYYWDHGIAKFPFDVGFTLPFNRNRGEIAEARAGRDLAGQRLLAVQADICGAIEAAERAEQAARAGAGVAERQWAAAKLTEQQAVMGLALGAAAAAERIGAEIIAVRAELAVLRMRTDLQNARNDLEDALHAPLSGPELALAEPAFALAAAAGT
jgi:outer membrane protein TolC